MAESFDAPMTDSGDTDISMFPGGLATAHSWLSAEASMGDVAFSTETATYDYVQGGIEIEMLDDEAIIEYDMADEGDAYGELQDVEVHDASRAPSVPPNDADLAVDAPVGDADVMQAPSSDGGVPASTHLHHAPESTTESSATRYSGAESLHQPVLPPSETDTSSEVVAADTSAAAAAPSSPHAPSPSEASQSTVAAGEGASISTSGGIEQEQASEFLEQLVTEPQSHPLSTLGPDEHEGSGDADTPHLEHPHPGRPETADLPATAEDATTELADDCADPHEISEGVYIDPPPPVLLSLPPSAEPSECCLFNQPVSTMPSSPSGSGESEVAAESLHLLLHDRPTLYYEPLSSVFDALRHQDCIQNLPGCAEAELVLDAYELQLAISEDNLYAHEVTLHELNVIHDGSDLHGPLRLRLKTVSPRFVTRYHLLRDQIARLNLTADGDESHAGINSLEFHHDEAVQDLESASQRSAAGESVVHEAAHADAEEQLENEVQLEARAGTEHDRHRNRSSDAEPYESTADGKVDHLVHGGLAEPSDGAVTDSEEARVYAAIETQGEPGNEVEEDGAPDSARSLAEEGRHGEDNGVEGSRDNEGDFDAHYVHEHADDGEGGDYVAHDEFPDDEDEFGDDLPEELGGETALAASIHPDATEGSLEESAYTEDSTDDHRATLVASEQVPQDHATSAWNEVHDEDGDQQSRNNGLETIESTNFPGSVNSADDREDRHESGDSAVSEMPGVDSNSVPKGNNEIAENFEQTTYEESTTLSSDDEDGLIDDWDNGEVPPAKPTTASDQLDPLSRKSSSATLASKASKRTYDEVELDDFDDDPSLLTAASSPDTKRLRVQ
ncbi:hypothetical protein BD414DRAFT_533614 [Trametes punicea]|nr:hypothetical protein BD414DRAFT_533614 [Trametes punicea]